MLGPLWRLARPLLFRMDAEEAHEQVIGALERWPRLSKALLGALAGPPDPSLACAVGPLRVAGPIGLAAGLDKDGRALSVWPALGFGFVEVGTVTPRAQAGNPPPRLFRLPQSGALINRMGFNNGGAVALAARMAALREAGGWPSVPVGANIGRNKDTPNTAAERDYLDCVIALTAQVDWFTVNVSSPNTPDLRALQAPDRLRGLLMEVCGAARPRPVFLKLAPDLSASEMAESVEVAIEAGCAGVIATNTTLSRPGDTGSSGEAGGLSGGPLWPLAQERIGDALRQAAGRIAVIGVGGVHRPDQAEALLAMGCAAVQLYSGLIFEGPALPGLLNAALAKKRIAG